MPHAKAKLSRMASSTIGMILPARYTRNRSYASGVVNFGLPPLKVSNLAAAGARTGTPGACISSPKADAARTPRACTSSRTRGLLVSTSNVLKGLRTITGPNDPQQTRLWQNSACSKCRVVCTSVTIPRDNIKPGIVLTRSSYSSSTMIALSSPSRNTRYFLIPMVSNQAKIIARLSSELPNPVFMSPLARFAFMRYTIPPWLKPMLLFWLFNKAINSLW
uniref:Uncharacterized protein n=1 Tax=Riboviria sp. TaxID=2585031 RepID=A0A8K1U2G0_9VIRU|nr:MAG: hypothetical protein 2 [Riboviria sp.]